MAIKKKVKRVTKPLKRKTATKPPLKKTKTFVGAEVKKTGTVRQGRGRVQTQTYASSGNEYVEKGPAVVANVGYNRDGTLIEKKASKIKSRGTTPTPKPTAKKAPIKRKKTVATKKKKTTAKKKKK